MTIVEAKPEHRAASWGNAGHIAIEQVSPLASFETLRSTRGRLFSAGGPVALPPSMIGNWGPFALRMLAASTPSRFASGERALAQLMAGAAGAWRRLIDDLGEPALVRFDGHFVAWESVRTIVQGKRKWAEANIGTACLRDASAQQLKELRERSPQIMDAMRFIGSGQIADLDALADALRRALGSAGIAFKIGEAKLEIGTDGSVRVPDISSDLVLVAAGVGSARLMRAAGHRAPLIAERGYHIRARDFDWPAEFPPVVFEDRGLIVTRFSNSLQVASFVEFGSADAPPDERKWERLERHALELELPMRPPFERWMGARPTLPDYLPAIGRSELSPNLFYAFGHHHLGLTLAPITAELMRSQIEGTQPPVDLAPFTLGRF